MKPFDKLLETVMNSFEMLIRLKKAGERERYFCGVFIGHE
jgi:hypothetical protein